MKKLFLAFVIAGAITACNSSSTSPEERKDSTIEEKIDSVDSTADHRMDKIDSTAEVKKDIVDSTADAKKDALKKQK
jgi:hypothetical protein